MEEGDCIMRHAFAAIDGFTHIEDASVVNDSLAIGLSLVDKRNEEAG
jgi:hypothetical protein